MGDEHDGLPEVLRAPRLIEELAAAEHERWSHWQQYLHDRCKRGTDGSLTIPADLALRWSRQMSTPYAELPEDEKDSDRQQVFRYLPIIASALSPDLP
jgi:hypothetical protein